MTPFAVPGGFPFGKTEGLADSSSQDPCVHPAFSNHPCLQAEVQGPLVNSLCWFWEWLLFLEMENNLSVRVNFRKQTVQSLSGLSNEYSAAQTAPVCSLESWAHLVS